MDLKMIFMKHIFRKNRKKEVWENPKGEHFFVPRDGNKSVETYLYRPKDMSKSVPVLFNLHGGAWIAGDASTLDSYCFDMVKKSGAFIVNINYTKVDVKPMPYAQEEIKDTIYYFKQHAKEYGIDTEKFVIIGYSAGGHLAASTALMLHKEGVDVASQVLVYPFLDFGWLDETIQDKKQLQRTYDLFFEKGVDGRNPYMSPVLASEDMCKGLGPVIFVCCGTDALTEGAEIYNKKLQSFDVKTIFQVYEEALHAFVEVNHKEYKESEAKNPMQEKLAKEAEDFIAEELKKIWKDIDASHE
jgi:acetyl esterase